MEKMSSWIRNHLQLYQILDILLLTVSWIEATIRTEKYTALKPGENITGKITEIYTSTRMDCNRRCFLDDWCVGCATTDDKRYIIIHRRGTEQEKQTLVSHAGGAIFTVNYAWNYTTVIQSPFGSWNGPPAVLYFDFDTLTGLGLMAGNGTSNYDTLVLGKVNKAVLTNSSLSQWVDLGVLSEACITVPDTCGPEGAAVSVWVKIYECTTYTDGFLSSVYTRKTGFMFSCFSTNPKIRYYVAVKNRKFWSYVSQTTHQWIHLVLNYIGPNNGQGIQAFKAGTPIKNRGEGVGDHTVGDGRVVVGKKYVYINNYYSHVEMDELIFFNKALLEEEVRELHNVYK